MSKIRVAIVDDNTNMVEKMEQVIEKENDMELVFKGADGEEAIGFFEEEESSSKARRLSRRQSAWLYTISSPNFSKKV